MNFRDYFFSNKKPETTVVNPIILEHLELIEKAPYNDKSTRDKIHRQWKELLKEDSSFVDQLYDVLIRKLENFDGKASEETINLYKFINTLSSNSSVYTKDTIAKNNTRLISCIEKLLAIPDFMVIDTGKVYDSGNLGSLIEKIIELYFYHSVYTDTKYKSEIAQYIISFYKTFPKNYSNLTASLIIHHPNAIEAYAELLNVHILEKNTEGILPTIASNILGLYAKREDFEHKNAVKIIKKVLDKSDSWTKEQANFFIDTLFFDVLGLDLTTKEEQLTKINEKIKELKAQGLHRGIKFNKEKKKEIEESFEINQQKKWDEAVRRVAVSKSTADSMKLVIQEFSGNQRINYLTLLISGSNTYKDKPKQYNLDQSPEVVFKDFALKLLVIEELMYNQNVLTPKFDIYEFAKEYDKRQIDIDNDGYDIIPEVKEYFQNLDIPRELLNKVTQLYMDDLYERSFQVYYQLCPFWHPGGGDDDIIPISNTAIDDLEFLPNLKKIIGLESKPDNQRLVQGIEEKGVVLMLES